MKQSRIYHQNAVRFIRRNRPKEIQRKPPLPQIKPGWRMPQYSEAYCIECQEIMRPIAILDIDEYELFVGCDCGARIIPDIAWPFVAECVHRSREALEKLGFEYID